MTYDPRKVRFPVSAETGVCFLEKDCYNDEEKDLCGRIIREVHLR